MSYTKYPTYEVTLIMLAPGWLGRKKHHFLQEDKKDALPYCRAQVLWICFFTFVFRLLALDFCKKCDIGVLFFFFNLY